ncbi:MAG: dipeptide ABC transporter ATP-binding protein [Pseudomonadota bacterium]
MTDTLLKVQDLKTQFGSGAGAVRAVDGVSFEIKRGETFALLGESGCGKSVTSLSIMRLVAQPAGQITGGSVLLEGQDLLQLPEVKMRDMRGGRIAMIFQEPMTSLNPVLTTGEQICESLRRHRGLKGAQAEARAVELLDAVGIPDPRRRIREYPHQLSGGMKQRIMIAIALAGEPELLIADEPTTALDVTIQAQILELLRTLQKERGMSIMLITHDLGVVAELADRVAVMYAGQIVEQAEVRQFFAEPRHPYSRKLFESLPEMGKRKTRLAVIPGSVPRLLEQLFKGCRFADRCEFAWQACRDIDPVWQVADGQGVRCHLYDPAIAGGRPQGAPAVHPGENEAVTTELRYDGALLQVDGLKVHYPIHKGLFQRVAGYVHAVDGVSFDIEKGRTLALVGESGCGKTTAGKAILQLIRSTGGAVRFQGERLNELRGEALRKRRADLQIIFQDPFSSMNPRMMVGDIIEEGMAALLGGALPRQARQARVDELMRQVGLSPEMKYRYPHEFSGGQRQRICIARALAVNPKLIVCDEPTSALDVSVQAQILNLLKRLQDELGLSYLFITHNLSVVAYLAHEAAVMYLGRIVEQGAVEEVLRNPQHPYTQALLQAVPATHPDQRRPVLQLPGELPSPVNPPAGCHFHPRCPHVLPVCREVYPAATALSGTHRVRCHLYPQT